MRARRIIVFAGPSLPRSVRPDGARFDWRPPACAGDIAALLDDPPDRLCLVDGLFDSHPAPWHKELMALMAAGTNVFGAASMGALRAAELDSHGMIGVGAIYAAFRDGRLTGDDEVAVIHATERLDWAPLSVPMVEVRATLIAACRQGLVTPRHAHTLRAAIARIYFADRDWPAICDMLVAGGLCDGALAGAIARLHVPLKRLDALACLEAAQRPAAEHIPPPPPPMTCFLRTLLGDIAR